MPQVRSQSGEPSGTGRRYENAIVVRGIRDVLAPARRPEHELFKKTHDVVIIAHGRWRTLFSAASTDSGHSPRRMPQRASSPAAIIRCVARQKGGQHDSGRQVPRGEQGAIGLVFGDASSRDRLPDQPHHSPQLIKPPVYL